ncbi:shikimate dehydrogenase [Paenibacillus woosongensis]|uniref:Shikimate dehydrogenase (NADP(+)) n=1 Tax=Paenibacillus woosongensis TaxID=307580 RepID=A0ABQ4MNR2_9BACL|nr:shikimate dehydrogenase [Paenibacillus woosongensis]GIP57633.1 shikimate dehydrogenase (NADP(+)) [Paenibacillus woosongensis]
MGNQLQGGHGLPLLFGVMGDPISQTKSPAMHSAALAAAGLTGTYVPLHVRPEQLEDAIKGIVALGYRGVNITVPHKVDVMKYVDVIDEAAKQIGAVNTIVNEGGLLTGYNTDGIGYIRSLKEEAVPDLSGKHVLVIGCGGAARGIVYALLKEKPGSVVIANRTAAKAQELADEWAHLGPISACGAGELERVLQEGHIDIVINTTSVGMYPNMGELPIPAELLSPHMVVSDLIYNPLKTELLVRAESIGCRIHNGLGMFVYQGAYAFEYWTGRPAPVEAMRAAVLSSLQA